MWKPIVIEGEETIISPIDRVVIGGGTEDIEI